MGKFSMKFKMFAHTLMLFMKHGLCSLHAVAERMLRKRKNNILQNVQKYFLKIWKNLEKKLILKKFQKYIVLCREKFHLIYLGMGKIKLIYLL